MVEAKPTGMAVSEAASEYGVSEATLYAAVHRGELPGARRIGKRIIIQRQIFEEWMRSGHGDPDPERSERE